MPTTCRSRNSYFSSCPSISGRQAFVLLANTVFRRHTRRHCPRKRQHLQFALPSRMIRHGPPRPKVHIPMLFVRERISHYHTPILSLHYLCDSCLTRHHFCLVVDCVLESGCELHKDAPTSYDIAGHRLPISSVNLFTVSTTSGAAVPRAPMPTSANLG